MKILKKIKPLFNRIITTMEVYEKDQITNGLVDPTRAKGSLKEYQTVLAVGSTVTDIKVGDVVCIDPTRYMNVEHRDKKSLRNNIIGDSLVISYNFNTIKLNNKECLMLYDQDITFIVEESEDVEDSTILTPNKPKIIV